MRDSYDMKGSLWTYRTKSNITATSGFPGYPDHFRNDYTGLRCVIS